MNNNKYNFNNTARISPAVLVIRLIVLEIIFGILFIVISLIDEFITTSKIVSNVTTSIETDILLTIILFTLQIFITLYLFLFWYNKFYVLDKNELISYQGIFFKKENRYVLKSLESVKYERSFIGDFLNFEDIIIKDAFISKPIKLPAIDNPKDFIQKVQALMGNDNVTFLGLMGNKDTKK